MQDEVLRERCAFSVGTGLEHSCGSWELEAWAGFAKPLVSQDQGRRDQLGQRAGNETGRKRCDATGTIDGTQKARYGEPNRSLSCGQGKEK
jgi:hypothetical protein